MQSNASAYRSMERYLREHDDNPVAAAGAYTYDRWKRGEHPREVPEEADRG